MISPSDARRGIAADDLYRFRLLSDPRISPDGEVVVYVKHRVEKKTQKKRANLWIVPTTSGPARPFTQGEHLDLSPAFSPDSETIAFLSNREEEKQPQIYLIPRSGGEARRLTDVRGSIQTFCWSPCGRRLVAQVRVKDEEEITREADEALGVVSRRITRLFFKMDDEGYLPRSRPRIVAIDIETGKTTPLTDATSDGERSPTWSPDGGRIAYLSNRSEVPDLHPDAVDLFVRSIDAATELRVDAPTGAKNAPAFSPDGQMIAYFGIEGEDPWGQTKLWVAPADASAPARCLTADHDLEIDASTINDMGATQQMSPAWAPDGQSIVVQVSTHGRTGLHRVALDGRITALLDEPGVVASYSFDANHRRLAMLFGTMTDPGQIRVLDAIERTDRALTDENGDLFAEIDLGAVEEVWFDGPGGDRLQGWILTPPGFDATHRYPSILEIHGGPQTQYGHFFMHEFFVLAAQGYVVHFCNPRGGRGYGEAHCRAIDNNWGTVDYDDLMAWTDLIAAKPYIDPERMGVTGGSYGGYMTSWIIGKTDRFRAAVTQRCVSNLVSMWGSSDFNWSFQRLFGGRPPWESLDNYWRQSPLKNVGAVVTPTLVIHSENDLRCAIEQGEQMYVALKLVGVDTEMIRYPDEPHGLSRTGRTDRRIDRLGHIARWFDTYL